MTLRKASSQVIILSALFLLSVLQVAAAGDKPKEPVKDSLKSSTFSGLKLRSIGPAFTSGRIADFAVNPKRHSEYYVAVASGNVWKTENNGTTFSPVFDKYGSYSTGVVTMDPTNHNVVWVGTGENNSQRALGYGDGVYKTLDGGEHWENMGLKNSRQIGGIVIDPRHHDVVFVAAQGSVWGPGGDRGLYKTTDGGKTWKKVLDISENTGIRNVVMDPVDPDVLYATSEQRRRHVYTKIGGGPESAVYKSTDNGETWRKIMKGLPEVDLGGMGIAVSPADHNVVYLIVEAAEDKGGFFRSTDRGETWQRMSDYSSSGQYFNEIYCDPLDVNKVYSTETVTQVTKDGGKTWSPLGNDNRHVDDHALWIDPSDTGHLLIGGDGGAYESFDGGKKWIFKSNLPVTQFYRVDADNTTPFYNVYGGTQDNNSIGGPSQNTISDGVTNEDWHAILGGDGFWVQVDPKDPDIIYTEYQYGNIYRFDKKSGETVNIKPQPDKGQNTFKWNWNTPFIISHFSNKTLYMGANYIFRSDDQGETWKVISDDITADIDRNSWPVMGHYWSIDAVAKDVSTSLYGMAVSLAESPVKEGLLYAGTDDGVISVSDDGGKTWNHIKSFPGVPANTYVSDIMPSRFDENVVYASFSNLKQDDFKPYVLMSSDKGKTWKSISANLPENGSVHTLQQDFKNPALLFAGTEFGAFFSLDGGNQWVQFKAGIPVIAIMDIKIQKRENALILGSFGRGIYILDDYTPLRELADDKAVLDKDACLFNIPKALMFIQTEGKYGQGAELFHAPNPPFGATFTYYLKEVPKTLTEMRHKKEKELFKEKKPIPQPSEEELRKEKDEVAPYLVFTVKDESGDIVRKISSKPSAGINREYWDLRYDSPFPVRMKNKNFDPTAKAGSAMLAIPGKYSVSLDMVVRGEVRHLADSVQFEADLLNNSTLPRENREAIVTFAKKVTNMARVMRGTHELAGDNLDKIMNMEQTILQSSNGSMDLLARTMKIEKELRDILYTMDGPKAKASEEELPPMPEPLNNRLYAIIENLWGTTQGVTSTMQKDYGVLTTDFPPVLGKMKSVMGEIETIEKEMNDAKIQWTPGRVPEL